MTSEEQKATELIELFREKSGASVEVQTREASRRAILSVNETIAAIRLISDTIWWKKVKAILERTTDFDTKTPEEIKDTSQITRVEVIQHSEPHNGRAYTNYNAKEVELQFQDNWKTLKIFLK
jgi:hypothetical protein